MSNPTLNVTIQLAAPNEYTELLSVVRRVFDEFVGNRYTDQGKTEFYKYIELSAFTARQSNNHFTLIAKVENKVAGVLEIREAAHVSLMFVDKQFQHQGIAKRLLQTAIERCKRDNPNLTELTVHSSWFACPIYQKLGFEPVAEETEVNGIRFTTMKLAL